MNFIDTGKAVKVGEKTYLVARHKTSGSIWLCTPSHNPLYPYPIFGPVTLSSTVQHNSTAAPYIRAAQAALRALDNGE